MNQPMNDPITIIDDARKARKILRHVIDSGHIHALDFETTGLDPKESEVVLVSISGPAWTGVFDLWAMEKPLKHFRKEWEAVDWVVFYSGFEYRFFWEHGCPDVALHDLQYMRKAILGGGQYGLKDVAWWDLKIEMSKELQASDWGAETLTEEQYGYAQFDAVVTYRAWKYWLDKSTDAQRAGYALLNNMVPAVIEMEAAGMTIDRKHHERLLAMWRRRSVAANASIRKLVPESEVPNLNSNKQISNFLKTILDDDSLAFWPQTEKSGDLKLKRDIITDMAKRVPYPLSRFLSGLAVLNRADKYISSFGETLLFHAEQGGGRIHPRFNVGAARTTRFSSSQPNAQNMPHNPVFRKSVIAGLGRVLVGGDLSGIEVRVLATMSGDEQLLHDTVYGDMHRAVAGFMLNKPIDQITKEERSNAKALTFLICYGGGSAAVAMKYGVSIEQAEEYIAGWAARYPLAMDFRNLQHEQAKRTGSLDKAGGGSMWVGKKASLPVCANYPIQGSAGDVMFATIIELKDRLDDARERSLVSSMTRMIATIHDELIVETTKQSAEIVEEMLGAAFTTGWLEIFPGTDTANLYETGTGLTWADIH